MATKNNNLSNSFSRSTIIQIEIIFHTASSPKVCKDVDTVYTKGGLLCIQHTGGLLMKYPLLNVFSIAQYHGKHLGTTRTNDKTR